jgi:hypothetical protein
MPLCRILDGNTFNGTLDLGRSISSELSMVSFKDNDFSSVTVTSSYNGTLTSVVPNSSLQTMAVLQRTLF